MDSMRTLNTSLPSTSPKKPVNRPPEQLLQSFKAAALSVTNLYKTAASDQAAAHEAGYQEAIEDLIAFLDKERTGLKNGEGSRVRQWAMDRLQGGQQQSNSESDEEAEEEKRARSSSPILERKPSPETPSTTPNTTTVVERCDSAPAASPEETRHVPSGDFTFRASHPYPTTADSEMDTSEIVNAPMNAATSMPSMRLEVFPRPNRNSNRHSNRNVRNITVPSLGPGAGMKRRQQIDELFDISNLGNGKDRFGGGKRGRFQ